MSKRHLELNLNYYEIKWFFQRDRKRNGSCLFIIRFATGRGVMIVNIQGSAEICRIMSARSILNVHFTTVSRRKRFSACKTSLQIVAFFCQVVTSMLMVSICAIPVSKTNEFRLSFAQPFNLTGLNASVRHQSVMCYRSKLSTQFQITRNAIFFVTL